MSTNENLAALSQWVDDANAHRDFEAQMWGRIAKISEEAGEVVAAVIGVTGQNPRKGVTNGWNDVAKELLDVAVTALGAWEHLTGNHGTVMEALDAHVEAVAKRAGVGPLADREVTRG